jgi:tetraacyldisaccharide 4'-kinase
MTQPNPASVADMPWTWLGAFHQNLARGRGGGWGAWALRSCLTLASVPYGGIVRGRNALYDAGWLPQREVSVPVVSVGNLTLGGTGKTPCVEYLARWCRTRGRRVAILSRGYGSRRGPNDEARLLFANLPDVPHLQGPDRLALARRAVEELASDVLVLDDGFQHRRLARNLDVVLIDATCPWGYGRLFPRGLLREPVEGLRRAGAVLLTRCDQASEADLRDLERIVRRIAPWAAVARARHRPVEVLGGGDQRLTLDDLRGKPALAFCGIGNPWSFRLALERLGLRILAFHAFPDHHSYGESTLQLLSAWIGAHGEDVLVLTTQKDWVKLPDGQIGSRMVQALRIALEIESGREEVEARLTAAIAAKGSRLAEPRREDGEDQVAHRGARIKDETDARAIRSSRLEDV